MLLPEGCGLADGLSLDFALGEPLVLGGGKLCDWLRLLLGFGLLVWLALGCCGESAALALACASFTSFRCCCGGCEPSPRVITLLLRNPSNPCECVSLPRLVETKTAVAITQTSVTSASLKLNWRPGSMDDIVLRIRTKTKWSPLVT